MRRDKNSQGAEEAPRNWKAALPIAKASAGKLPFVILI
jgi:hypothetical protein